MLNRDFFFGILVGGSVGALIALLFAPQEGKQTRKMISDTGRSARDKARDGVSRMTSTVSEKVQGTRRAVKQAI